jgi:N-acetylmuramoyl-L-alanine amidase
VPSSSSERAAAVLLIVGLLLFSVRPVAAQQWTVGTGSSSTTVTASETQGYAALPASLLTALGAEVVSASGQSRITIGRSRIVLVPGSPFYTAGDQVRQLIHAPYVERGVLYLPIQFFVDHLPTLEPGLVTASIPDRTLRAPSPPARAEAPPRTPTPAAAAPEPAPPAQPQVAPAARTPAPGPTTSRRLVVIDAGHGGVDPGARGPGGTREKDVTLAIALQLAAILREDPTLEVRMTRDRDTLIALTDRGRLANTWRANGQDAVFMSIHANASERRAASGFETFFLSEAKTEDARRVAEMENAAQRFETEAPKLDPISFIMHDLRQNRYLRDSSDWAAMIQRRLAAVHPGPNRGVKQAGFVVLDGAFMPAVLVEIGFISNPQEEQMMGRSDHQRRIAQQLANSVRDFFDQPNRDTAR